MDELVSLHVLDRRSSQYDFDRQRWTESMDHETQEWSLNVHSMSVSSFASENGY